jgi:acetoin utilization protein AcuB
MTVAEIMVKPVVTAEPGMSVGAARRLSRRERVRHLPVLDGERLLVGIVSDRDLRGARSDAIPVREIMTRPVFVLSPDTPIRQAARLFRERRFGAMPVLAGRELVGIVSVVDILRALDEQ